MENLQGVQYDEFAAARRDRSSGYHPHPVARTDIEKEEQAIRELVAAREAAWNAGDTAAYAQLLTEDADILSASGRAARGRDSLLKLFAEQHANVYAGVRTRTRVAYVRMLGPAVALADVEYRLEGGEVDAIRKGAMAFVLKKDPAGRWRIAAIRSIPEARR